MNAARVTTVDTTAIAAALGDKEAEVAAAAMREWDRQHGWLHS